MQWCWQHPGVIGLELLWRWIFGVFALSLLWVQGSRIFAIVTGGTNDLSRLELDKLSIMDPTATTARLTLLLDRLLPPMMAVALWLVPVLLVAWLITAALGRTAVLRRADPGLHARPGSLLILQLLRILALGACLSLWFLLLEWIAAFAITQPLLRGEQPNLVEYFAVAIVLTLSLFATWALLSWALSLAPLLAMLNDENARDSLRHSLVRGPVRMKLIEINLVMGIVKIALLVLAMVFSACPLPFQTVITPQFLFWWTLGVALLYVLASDFFHVARQIAYLELWRAYAGKASTP